MDTNYFFQYLNFYKDFKLLKSSNLNFFCAISSGQDSMFLFLFFLHLQFSFKFKLNIFYCNHLWQQQNFYSFKQIYKIVYIFNLPIYLYINEKEIQNESIARNWRKDSYNRLCLMKKSKHLLLGHTATDQIETAFFNIIRGSSPHGISNLKYSKKAKIPNYINIFVSKFYFFPKYSFSKKNLDNKLYSHYTFYNLSYKKYNANKALSYSFFLKKKSFFIKNKSFYSSTLFLNKKKKQKVNIIYRPLLKLHRNDIIILSKIYKIPIIFDFSNLNYCFSRNYIRTQIFSYFRQNLNNTFDLKFFQYLNILIEEQKLIEFFVRNLIKKKNSINTKKLPIALQRRYLFSILKNYLNLACTYSQLEKCRRFFINENI